MSTQYPARLAMFLAVVILAAGAIAEEVDRTVSRTWTSSSGQTIDGVFKKMQYNTVYLEGTDGKVISIHKSKLSADDQKIADEWGAPKVVATAEVKEEAAKAPKEIQALFGSKLKNAQKKSVSVDELAGKTIGVYFSAHWCPPCRAFTPKLVEFHNTLNKDGKPFEIVFVSSDHDSRAMYTYMKETKMPWLALDFDDKHKQALAKKYNVRGIPKLVILNSSGELITEDGSGDVSGRGVAAFDAWQKK